MTIAEIQPLKEDLIQWVQTVNDTRLLSLLNLIKLSDSQSDDWWNELTDSQKENINLGLKDLEEGNVISSKEFWKGL